MSSLFLPPGSCLSLLSSAPQWLLSGDRGHNHETIDPWDPVPATATLISCSFSATPVNPVSNPLLSITSKKCLQSAFLTLFYCLISSLNEDVTLSRV